MQRPKATGWILAALLGTAGCGGDEVSPPAAVDASLEVADDAVSEQIAELRQRIAEAPRSAKAHGELGLAYEMSGRVAAARESYARAAELAPSEPRWTYLCAVAIAELGDLEAALETLDRAIAAGTDYAPAYLYRGQWLLDLGRAEEAGRAFAEATRLADEEPAGWIGIARVHLKLGRPQEAARLLERLLARGDDPYVRQILGQAYREMGDLDRARAVLTGAKPGAPTSWSDPWRDERFKYRAGFGGGMLRASTLMKQNRVAEAVQLMEELRAQDPDDRQLLNNLSVAYRNLGQPDRAFQVLQDGLERHPDYYPFHLNISADYQRMGDLEQALAHLRRVTEISPGLAIGYERIGGVELASGRPEKALEAYLEAARSAPDKAAYPMFAGILLLRLERWDEAAKQLVRTVELDPSQPAAWISLGRAEAERGRFDDADAALERAAALAPGSSHLADARARLAELRGAS